MLARWAAAEPSLSLASPAACRIWAEISADAFVLQTNRDYSPPNTTCFTSSPPRLDANSTYPTVVAAGATTRWVCTAVACPPLPVG